VPSEFGTTNQCLENRTLKTSLFLQFFEPGLGFTVEDEFENLSFLFGGEVASGGAELS
jgi:hypothetical protein